MNRAVFHFQVVEVFIKGWLSGLRRTRDLDFLLRWDQASLLFPKQWYTSPNLDIGERRSRRAPEDCFSLYEVCYIPIVVNATSVEAGASPFARQS